MMSTSSQQVPTYVKALAVIITLVVSGCGLLAVVSRYAPARSTRFGYLPALEGSSAQAFGLSIFFFGLIPLAFLARSGKQAAWMVVLVATLGTISLFINISRFA